jgi:hypothetical protein
MKAQQAEGWYEDPYHVHRDRWMSDGVPTKLVRDGQAESYDPPPDLLLPDALVPVAEAEPADGSDLRRADDASNDPYDPEKARDAASTAFDMSSGAG